jgi:hypothetical protein
MRAGWPGERGAAAVNAVAQLHKPKREAGLRVALIYEDGYGNWGWWCPNRICSPGETVCGNDGFKTRGGARDAAHAHEKRRSH